MSPIPEPQAIDSGIENSAKAMSSVNSQSGPRYPSSRTADEWRAYHRKYYRKNAERRRQQAAEYQKRRKLIRVIASYSRWIPKRLVRHILRDELAQLRALKSRSWN